MAIRDLIPWSRQENRLPVPVRAEPAQDQAHPLLSLHREVNRLLDDVFRGFGTAAFGGFDRAAGWPHIEFAEPEKEIRITADLPGLAEKAVEIRAAEGALTLRCQKRAEAEAKERGYSEASSGRLHRRTGLHPATHGEKT